MAQMPALATGLPSTESGKAPDAYQRLSATPDMFGAQAGRELAAGSAALGQGAQNLSTGLFKTADIFNEAAADDAANRYQESVNALLTGGGQAGPDGEPDAGYMGLKGRAALDARPEIEKKLQALQTEIGGKLANPQQQKRFNDFATKYGLATKGKIGAYADAQAREWYGQVNKASEVLALQQIASNAYSPEEVAAGASDLIAARTKQAELSGARKGDPVWTAAFVTAKQDALKAQVEAIGVADPAKALDILSANRELASTGYDELSTKFRVRAAEQKGRQAAEAAMAFVAQQPPAPVVREAVQGATQGEARQVSGPVAPERVHAAIVMQESGGRMEVPVSVNGAIGPGQIMPDTFKRYALPNERIDNPADNLAVSQRIVADLSRKYGNDAARVAVGYFSGEGNVAPPGSPTPWKEDRKDGNGKSVSSYVADVTQRLGAEAPVVPLEARIAQNRGEAVRRILADPSLANDPAAKQAALAAVKQSYDAQTLAAEQDARARKDANDRAADGYIKAVNAGQITPATLLEINGNPALTWETRRSLYDAALKKSGSDVTASAQAYGPGFWDAFRKVTAPPGDPNRIMDIGELLRRAGPGGDLTLDGVAKLNDALKEMAKPENAAVADMKRGAMAYAKSQLSFEFEMGNFKLADPKGMDDFNTKFIPAFYQAYEDGIKSGKTPYQLLSKDSNDFIVDKLVSAYKRPEAQLMRDRIAAGGNPMAPAAPNYDTPDKLKAAVRDGKLTREQGVKLAIEKGWARMAEPTPKPPGP